MGLWRESWQKCKSRTGQCLWSVWQRLRTATSHMTLTASFRKHILHLSHNIYYTLHLKSYWQCNLCDECLPFCDIMNIGCLQASSNSDKWNKGKNNSLLSNCPICFLSKRVRYWYLFFLGVMSWKSKSLDEPAFWYIYQQNVLLILWKIES